MWNKFSLKKINNFIPEASSQVYSPVYIRLYAVCVLALFAVVHTPLHFIELWYQSFFSEGYGAQILSSKTVDYYLTNQKEIFSYYITPLRFIIFFSSLIVVAFPLIQSIISFVNSISSEQIKQSSKQAFFTFGILCILTIPNRLGLMGEGYALMSFDPFGFIDQSGQYYQRIMMPVISSLLQLKGPFLFWVFSLCITFLIMMAIVLYFKLNNFKLELIELVSLGTSAFFITQLQSPGYPEQFAYLLMLIVLIVPTTPISRLSIFILAILSHEASIVPFIGIAFYFFGAEERRSFAVVTLLYTVLWAASYEFNFQNLLSVRQIGGISGIEWIIKQPLRELLGILISYKLLWIVIGIVFYQMSSLRPFLLSQILAGLLLTVVATDTSRLMGYSFLVILLSFLIAKKFSFLTSVQWKIVMVVNILIPSSYIAVNAGIVFFNGLYQWFVKGVLIR